LQQDERNADYSRGQQRADERNALLGDIARAECLGGERDGPHPQETEQPEQAVEHDRRHGDGAEQMRQPEAADRGGRDHTEQRCGCVCERHRHRDREHAPVCHAECLQGIGRVHARGLAARGVTAPIDLPNGSNTLS
jgi:hypothetical protein